VIGIETAVSCSTAFLAARFSGAPRHVRRVAKIRAIEQEAARLEAAHRTT
jgi:ribose 5-phosphate isomerase RpiB